MTTILHIKKMMIYIVGLGRLLRTRSSPPSWRIWSTRLWAPRCLSTFEFLYLPTPLAGNSTTEYCPVQSLFYLEYLGCAVSEGALQRAGGDCHPQPYRGCCLGAGLINLINLIFLLQTSSHLRPSSGRTRRQLPKIGGVELRGSINQSINQDYYIACYFHIPRLGNCKKEEVEDIICNEIILKYMID